MARSSDNANDIKELQAAIADLRQEVSGLKSEEGPEEGEGPKKRVGGLLPGKNRAQTEAIRAAEAERVAPQKEPLQPVPLGGPGSDEFPGLDEFEENQARLRASRGAREDIENLPNKDVLEAQKDAKGALDTDFVDLLPNIPHASSPPPVSLADALSAGAGKEPAEVPSQPGLIKLKALNEEDECRLFEVIGSDDGEADGCGTGGSGTTLGGISMTGWWQPTYNSDTKVLSIAKGLNLAPSLITAGKSFPSKFWQKFESHAETKTLVAGANPFYVQCAFITGDKVEQAVANNLKWCEEGPPEAEGDCEAYINQTFYILGNGMEGAITIEEGATATDTDMTKHQYLGTVTLDAEFKVTSWDWRLNHCFYWDYMALSTGSFGHTQGSHTDHEFDDPESH